MSEESDSWKQYKSEQKIRREERLPVRTAEILSLIDEGYSVIAKSDYQFRVNDLFDLYPIHNRIHHLKTGKRFGSKNLKQWVLKNVPVQK